MAKKILIFGLPFILLVLLLIYFQLGGFNKVRITIHEPEVIYIIGREYSGRYQSVIASRPPVVLELFTININILERRACVIKPRLHQPGLVSLRDGVSEFHG